MLNIIEFYKTLNLSYLTIFLYIVMIYVMSVYVEKFKLKINSHKASEKWFIHTLRKDFNVDVNSKESIDNMNMLNKMNEDVYGIVHDSLLTTYHNSYKVFYEYLASIPYLIVTVLFYIIFIVM